jgi:hypothetical protein
MTGFNINEIEFRSYGTGGGDSLYQKVGKRLIEGDGLALQSATHPRPVWYARPYWAFLCWLARFRGLGGGK